MSDMTGNPHYSEDLPEMADTNDGRTVAAATLALAYEQRTANRIAYLDWLTKHELNEHCQELDWDIRVGLGLEAP